MGRAKKKTGKVYLVGAGPGDPGLISVRGLRLVQKADVIIYDRLVNPAILAEALPGARLLPARHGKYGYGEDQTRIHRMILQETKRFPHVVRLKGGDPFLYGRGREELDFLLRHHIPVEVVPGVTAAIGASAYAGIPLTDRATASCVTFATGQGAGGKRPVLPQVPRNGTLVVYMGLRSLPDVVDDLKEQGWDPRTPAAVVASATRPDQKVVMAPLSKLVVAVRKARLSPPALGIFGEVARRPHRWFHAGPFRGRTIVVTRPRKGAGVLTPRLVDLGANVIEVPVLQILPPSSWKPIDAALRRLDQYWGVVFTSAHAVDPFFDRLQDARRLAGKKLIAVGPATGKAIRSRGVGVDLIPPIATVSDLAKSLSRQMPPGARLLHPCSNLANPILRKRFRCDDVIVYRTVPSPHRKPSAALSAADFLTFTSAETVRQFSRQASAGLRRVPAVCIGPVTARAARQEGFRVAATATPHTLDGLLRAIRKVLRP